MENRKDIGKAISDKLNSLDKSPREQVWTGINEELQKKKKRRFVFLYFWGGTIGLLLICAITAFYVYRQNNEIILGTPNNATDSITVNGSNERKFSTSATDKNSKINDRILIDGKNAPESGNNTNNKFNINETNTTEKLSSTDSKTENTSSKTSRKASSGGVSSKAGKNNLTLLSKANSKKTDRKSAKKAKRKSEKNKAELPLTQIKAIKSDTTTVDLISLQNKTLSDLTSEMKKKKTDSIAKKDKEKTITINMYPKDSIKKDSAKIYNKFDVDVFISPIFYGYFGNESTLDSRLDSLPKKSEIKFGYGLGLTYNLSEKLSLRIGYSKVNLSYTTKNAPIDVPNYSGIAYNPNISNETILSASQQIESPNKMDITQKISYTEIPFEFKYKFLDKKIGLRSSLGFSYLLLNENKISIKTANGFSQDIGKTKGLSQTSLSLNVGVALDYPLFKNMKVFAEPLFSYQVKAFSESTFKPYLFGIHTGIRYSFNNK